MLKKFTAVILSVIFVLSQFSVMSTFAATPESDFSYEEIDGNIRITGYLGESANLDIPSTIDGKTVTAIGNHAFFDRRSITEITIPSTVTYIGEYAFKHTGYYHDLKNWEDGLLYIGDCLISSQYDDWGDEYNSIHYDDIYCVVKDGTRVIAENAFENYSYPRFLYIPASIATLGRHNSDIREILYGGNSEQWNAVAMNESNNYQNPHTDCTPDDLTVEITDSTCYKEGNNHVECGICGYKDDFAIWKKEHQKGTLLATVAPTCGGSGYKVYSCKVCSAKFRSDWNYTCPEHKKGKFIRKYAPTCEERGYSVYRCSECLNEFPTDYVDSLGGAHDKATVVEVVAPSCANFGRGYTVYKCSHCNVEYQDDYVHQEGIEHNYAVKEVIAPSCANGGWGYTVYKCTVCGEEYTGDETYAEVSHNYVLKRLVTQTCTEDAYSFYECSICKSTRINYHASSLGHIKGQLIKTVKPTCSAPGYKEYKCQICKENFKEYDRYNYAAHSFVNGVCKNCKAVKADIIETPHEYTHNYEKEWSVTRKGCTSIKITFSKLTYTESCDFIEIFDKNGNSVGRYSEDELAGKTIEIPGDTAKIKFTSDSSVSYYGFSTTKIEGVCKHTYKLTGSKAATCTAAGYKTYKCTACGHSYTQTIAKIAHKTYVTGKKTATYFSAGSTGKTVCKTCKTTITAAKTIAKKTLAKPSVTVKAGSKSISVKYKSVSGATGYQIRYRLSGTSKWTVKTYSSSKAATKTIKSLKKNKKYNVQVRAMVTKGSSKAYSSWTATKTVKVK